MVKLQYEEKKEVKMKSKNIILIKEIVKKIYSDIYLFKEVKIVWILKHEENG
jgi:hypothetical protein